MFQHQNVIILDLEIQNDPTTVPNGWANKAGLGLAVGAWYSYRDDRVRWFDMANVLETIEHFVSDQPLMVSFNGISFDFALMRAVLHDPANAGMEAVLADFKALAAHSYDILAEVWRTDPKRKFERGLNSLDAILLANDLGQKSGSGEQAARWWQAGEYDRVKEYCADDVKLTKALFELICAQQGHIQRRNGPLAIRYVDDSLMISDPMRTV